MYEVQNIVCSAEFIWSEITLLVDAIFIYKI